MRRHQTLEELAEIAAACEDTAPAELARRLDLPYTPMLRAVQRFRRAGGWCTPLKLPPCTECGEVVVGPPKRVRHPACEQAYKARWVRDRRAKLRETRAPEAVEAARLANLRNSSRYYHALPPERQAELLADWRARGAREYRETLASADRKQEVWTEDEDAHILATMDSSGREVGLTLGRTLWAVYKRRGKLRRYAL